MRPRYLHLHLRLHLYLRLHLHLLVASLALGTATSALDAQRAGGGGAEAANPFPGGENLDGSLRPSARLTRLFTQDAYTEYALLEPGSGAFVIRFLPEVSRVGATELVNATRGGSEGSDIAVYDPRTGEPLPFTYEGEGDDHAIRAQLPRPVPEGGIGRVLIYKTYTDARTYQVFDRANARFDVQPGDITWTRSLSGYRLGVILPRGFSLLSSNVAAQIGTTADGRVKLHFANPSGVANLLSLHARPTRVAGTPTGLTDMFFDDVKTLYDLGDPSTHRMAVEQVYSDYRQGSSLPLDLLSYAPLSGVTVVDLDTGKPLQASGARVSLEVPITNDRQSAHLRVTGSLTDAGYTLVNGELILDRTMKGLRNTVLLPEGWELSSVSQSATVGMFEGRVFVALINLNHENSYRVVVRARKR
jgi:hypothetical protein